MTVTSQADFLPQLQRAGQELRKKGFALTLRYGGKGEVPLSNIFPHLPIEGIKIASSIWTPDTDKKQRVMAKAVTDICRQLNIFLAADTVQTPQEQEHIKQLGFQYALGSAIAPAKTPDELALQRKSDKPQA